MKVLISTRFFAKLALAAAALSPAAAFAADLPVCERTPAVTKFIVDKINEDQGTQKACSDITAEDLASLNRVSIEFAHVKELKAGDFSGLPNLEILNIRSNEYTTLPEGLFKGLTKLKTLVIISTKLRYYPDDFLADTPNLVQCYCFRNEVRSISESVFQRLEGLASLQELEFDGTLQPAEKARIEKFIQARPDVSLFFHGG